MIGIFLKLYPSKDIKLSSSLDNAFILSSFEDMEEVIGNIVENSCKWAGTSVLLEIKKSDENHIQMIFSDDGPGLPQDKMKKVFARGFRLDEQTPGTGLGLNIVKDIVETTKGEVWLTKSSKFGGLEVNIKLPLAKV